VKLINLPHKISHPSYRTAPNFTTFTHNISLDWRNIFAALSKGLSEPNRLNIRHLTRHGTYRGITIFSIIFVGYYIQDRQCKYDVTLRRVGGTILALENTIIVTYYEWTFVATVMQHARRTCRMVIGDLSGCTRLSHII